ncbi:hypothetical protein B9Z55_019512 [Caenorhabditis nigoni]|uniref:Uncharacterized protein n=1 Tax=Caenorhabditis nigoni TaxID=1611254 RepID=A0A2G5TIR2_9PELO|nr:hypothetical protein B9Z55_019512 [Caenorhabditis nigoni]
MSNGLETGTRNTWHSPDGTTSLLLTLKVLREINEKMKQKNKCIKNRRYTGAHVMIVVSKCGERDCLVTIVDDGK